MKILVIGRGGREHVLAWKVKESPQVEEVFVAPGNDGMRDVATILPIEENDFNQLSDFAKKEFIDLTIVGPEAPLTEGIVNHFKNKGLRIFGPTKEAAIIEGSKQFAKDFMKKYSIPTAEYQSFTDIEAAKNYVRKKDLPIVIKADGLAAGKGVIIANSIQEADQAIEHMLKNQTFGAAGQTVVIEDFLVGEEFSLMAFVNGDVAYPMEISQDHKRAFDQDRGPNTGGMGAYSPVPQISQEIIEKAINTILEPTAKALVKEGRSFQGVLYVGLIATTVGPKVIEYNARFGDPEAQVVLPRLNNDLIDVIQSVMRQDPCKLYWSPQPMVGVVLASKGYPGSYEKGKVILNVNEISDTVCVFHAGTKINENEWVTNGGRLLLVGTKGSDFKDAKNRVYHEIKKLKTADTYYRTDIAERVLSKNY